MAHDSRSSGSVSRRALLSISGTIGATALAGCLQENPYQSTGDGESDSLSGTVVVTGSSTVFPISEAIAEEFMNENPEVNVTTDATGSGGGFENHFCPGDSDINGASRPITESETEHCQGNDVEPVEFEIAGDALTVAVNNDADWVDSMTFEELSQIWRADGAERWSDIRDEWPDERFELFGPASTSGTYDWFNEHAVGEEYSHTAEHEPTEEDNLIVQGIQDSPYAMGYFGYAYYSSNSESVKALDIAAEEGDEPTPPSLANAKDGSYPMARPLFIYADEAAIQREAVYEYLKFYIEQAETSLVEDIGYVPINAELRNQNLGQLVTLEGQ